MSTKESQQNVGKALHSECADFLDPICANTLISILERDMEKWKEAQLKQISLATDLETAYQISLNFTKNIGFNFLGLTTTRLTNSEDFTTKRFNNYPHAWNIAYDKKNLSATDPVVAHCNQSTLPVLWCEQLYEEFPSIWLALEQQGLQHGWSQAIHDEESGFCSILSLARTHCPVSAWELYEILGFFLLIGHSLHRLVVQTLPKEASRIVAAHLSPREIDVLNLAAAGKTAYESARILNLSARTIHFHVQEVIRKFGVNNKVSAVIAAAKAGYLNNGSTR